MSETKTARITAESWTELDVDQEILKFKNMGTRTIHLVVDTTAPATSVYNGVPVCPGDDLVDITIGGGDKVFARVYAHNMAAKSTLAWHELSA